MGTVTAAGSGSAPCDSNYFGRWHSNSESIQHQQRIISFLPSTHLQLILVIVIDKPTVAACIHAYVFASAAAETTSNTARCYILRAPCNWICMDSVSFRIPISMDCFSFRIPPQNIN
jgi:hypothetical protein